MPRRFPYEFEFPVGGIVRRYGFQKQPPYTTFDAENVRPDSSKDGRVRGGVRPGLTKAFAEQLGGGAPVNLLATLQSQSPNTLRVITEAWATNPSLGSTWEILAGRPPGLDPATPLTWPEWSAGKIFDQKNVPYDGASRFAGLTYKSSLWTPDTNKQYTITVNLKPVFRTSHPVNHILWIFVGMGDTTPSPATCTAFKITMGYLSGTGKNFAHINGMQLVGGVIRGSANVENIESPPGDVAIVNVSPDAVTLTVFGRVLTLNADYVVGHGFGFGIDSAPWWAYAGQLGFGSVRVDYHAQLTTKPNMLCAAAGGNLYYLNASDAMTEVTLSAVGTDDPGLASESLLRAADWYGKLYIADIRSSYRGSGTAGASTTGTNKFDEATVNWSNICEVGDSLWIYSSATPGNVREWKIAAVDAGGADITLTVPTGVTYASQTGQSWRILRAPAYFDSSGPHLKRWVATAGGVPCHCPLIARVGDRIYLAGSEVAPHVWYCARAGDPFDWDFSASDTDISRAMAGTSSDAGSPGKPITCLIGGTNDYLIVGCQDELWVLRGNPAGGGIFDNLSKTVGIVGAAAFCHGPRGEVIFLSRAGLYILPPGAGAFPEPLSEQKLPIELRDVDASQVRVSLAYDTFASGVHIWLTPITPGAPATHWWFDWESQSYWIVTLPVLMEPTACARYLEIGSGESDVMLGGRDGYIRRFDKDLVQDDGEDFDSFVCYGPIPCGGDAFATGLVQSLVGELSTESENVDWEILTGDSPEEAAESTDVRASGSWGPGLNYTERPRVRGHSMVLRLSSRGEKWAIERVGAYMLRSGTPRKL